LVLDGPIADRRQCYRLAKALLEVSPQPGIGAWVRHLERGGVIMGGVPFGLAEPARLRLAEAGQNAVMRPHAPEPDQSHGRRWWLVGMGAAALTLLAVLLATRLSSRRSTPTARPAVAERAAPSAPSPAAGSPAPAPREVAAQVLPSVVVLRCKQQTGSGFFVAEHRVLTNAHVTCGDEALDIELADGTKGEAHVVAADERLDLALVETTLGAPPLPYTSAGDLAAGDTVMAAGAPMGLERSFNVGTLSNPRRVMLGVSHLQIDARINPGNSGGPLLDARGRVVGVVSMKREHAEGIAFAVPIDYAFEGPSPLLPPPVWHPKAGFRSMLEEARRDDERLLEESRRVRMQVVRAVVAGRGRVLAVVLSANSGEPEDKLYFRFEQQERAICRLTGVATWQENQPDQGLAKRASEWMNRTGIGKVYTGFVSLDARECQFERGSPIDLVMEEGDETTNRVRL
jgi:putative serine protease PepD